MLEIHAVAKVVEVAGIRTTTFYELYFVNGRLTHVFSYREEVIILGYSP